MVQYAAVHIVELHGVPFIAAGAVRPDAEETHHDIPEALGPRTGAETALDSDSGSGRGLASDGDLAVLDTDRAGNYAAHRKDHDPGALRAARFLKAARAAGVEVGHPDHSPAPAARSVRAESLGFRETGQLSRIKIDREKRQQANQFE